MLLRVDVHVGVSLMSSFFVGLLGLPVSFFSAGLVNSLVRQVGSRGQMRGFLAARVLGIAFSLLDFVIFNYMLLNCGVFVFLVFLAKDVLCNV